MESNISGSFLFNNSLNQFPSDIKAPVCQYSIPNSFYKLSPANINAQLQAGTPHGISDILSRSMMGGPGTPALLSGYPSMGGFGTAVPSPGVYYNRDYAPAGLSSFSKPGVECSGLKGKGSSCWWTEGTSGEEPDSSVPTVSLCNMRVWFGALRVTWYHTVIFTTLI